MPAQDVYHEAVRNALVKDGWTITHEPYTLKLDGATFFVDLGAEQLFGAQKNDRKIAVEVKSFLGPSEMKDLQQAVGQFILYSEVMHLQDPDRTLFVAVTEEIYLGLFQERIGQLVIQDIHLRLVVIDPRKEELRLWIPPPIEN